MSKNRVALMMLAATVAFAAPVFADNDPTVQQIYEEAKVGHLAQAQTMIDQVLRDHPTSSKAHYVAAEIAAKRGNLTLARDELKQAQTLDPGLTKENPQSVRALKAELGLGDRGAGIIVPTAEHHFPWGAVLLGVGVIAVLFLIFRRRSAPTVYQGGGFPGGGMAPVGGAPNPYGSPGGYGAPAGGGIGSTIAGGLASGLAVGAGVVAGEELAHHFLDGRRDGVAPAPEYTEPPASNGDMGGNDFGVNDPGSWDDSGGGGGGGGDDWS